ncbi:MAG TPA: stage II sporulation protein P [Tissierellia bacterium]|nr:stage II sporulation protein P [Tissierellia bacterium]
MRENYNRNNYIIFALICLIAFNIGSFLISWAEGKTDDYHADEAWEVFKQETYQEDEKLFISLLSKASSIINLYKNQQPIRHEEYPLFNLNILLRNTLNRFLKAQFPAILNFNLFLKDNEVLNEDNIEEYEMNSKIAEDFIIIESIEEYKDLIVIRNEADGSISIENIPDPVNVKPLEVDDSKPYILIYHTHGTEAYSSLETNEHHTTDLNYNVTTIGKIIAETMEQYGHKVEHVSKYHDVPSYSKSYSESLKTISEKIQENSNFKILLDIHRNGFDQNDPDVKANLDNLLGKTKINIDGKEVATFFFVIGPDSENTEAVLNFAKYIKAITDAVYPNLCTGILIKPVGRYNQFLSDYSALIEIGSNLNTMEEAKETARILGEILNVAIDKIKK